MKKRLPGRGPLSRLSWLHPDCVKVLGRIQNVIETIFKFVKNVFFLSIT